MKNYFIRLFNYDKYANRQISELILSSRQYGKPVHLMSHLFTAQQTWLKRCKALPAPGGPLWPEDWEPETFASIIDNTHQEWVEYLETLAEEDFDKVVSYESSAGRFQNTLSDIIAHVINHGTHHRAQVGQYLKLSGVQLPLTDYILYVRQLNNKLL